MSDLIVASGQQNVPPQLVDTFAPSDETGGILADNPGGVEVRRSDGGATTAPAYVENIDDGGGVAVY